MISFRLLGILHLACFVDSPISSSISKIFGRIIQAGIAQGISLEGYSRSSIEQDGFFRFIMSHRQRAQTQYSAANQTDFHPPI